MLITPCDVVIFIWKLEDCHQWSKQCIKFDINKIWRCIFAINSILPQLAEDLRSKLHFFPTISVIQNLSLDNRISTEPEAVWPSGRETNNPLLIIGGVGLTVNTMAV